MKNKLLPAATVILASAFLLLASTTLFPSVLGGLTGDQDAALAQAGSTEPVPGYHVVQNTMVGEGYRLTNLAWRVSGTASGEGYVLRGPAMATLRGSGCCCTYLPITVRRAK